MSDADPSPSTVLSKQFEKIANSTNIPVPVEKEAVTILETLQDSHVTGSPEDPAVVAAAVLLAKRNTELTKHYEAETIAEELDDTTYKQILAAVNRLADSNIETPPVKPSVRDLVEALDLAAMQLTVSLDEPELNEWCEQHGLGKNGPASEIIARQASLTVFLRAIVFDDNSTVDPTNLSQDIYPEAVRRAHQQLGDRSPTWFALDTVVRDFPKPVFNWIVELRDHIELTETPSDYLGKCYEELIDQEERWRLGQFRTPPDLATLVAELGFTDWCESILSPGVGAGALVTAAASAKHKAHRIEPLSDIHAVDVSPLSLLLGSAALLELHIEGTPTFYQQDFFDMGPEDVSDIDVVLSNPPYTKHHELSPEEKSALNEQIEAETGYSFSKLSPLYVYFTVHATQFLEPGDGRAVFLTPAEILNTKYGTDWKEFLLDHYEIEAFILFEQGNGSQFGDVATTSLITVANRTDNPSDEHTTRCIRIDDAPSMQELHSYSGVHDEMVDIDTDNPVMETDWGFVRKMYQQAFDAGDNWGSFFDDSEVIIDDKLVQLNDLARVTRGIATGQNSFFCLSESDCDGTDHGTSWSIDERFLAPVIRKSHKMPYYDYRVEDWENQLDAGTEAWLLYHLDDLEWDPTYFAQEIADEKTSQQQLTEFSPDTDGDGFDDEAGLSESDCGVVSYLKYGMELENPPHKTHLAESRDRWYVVEQRKPADILYTSMTRGKGRFVYNRMGARNLNNVHSIHLTVELSDVERKALLAYLNSEFADTVIKQSGRTLSSGMSKVEPGDLKNIPVIDPRELDDEIVSRLADHFDELCTASRDGRDESGIRAELQQTLQSFLQM